MAFTLPQTCLEGIGGDKEKALDREAQGLGGQRRLPWSCLSESDQFINPWHLQVVLHNGLPQGRDNRTHFSLPVSVLAVPALCIHEGGFFAAIFLARTFLAAVLDVLVLDVVTFPPL